MSRYASPCVIAASQRVFRCNPKLNTPSLNSKICSSEPVFGGSWKRRSSHAVDVRWGGQLVTIGGDAPVRVQSMTNTDTADAIGTAIQVKELAQAGSELVRITVNTPEAAAAVPARARAARPDGRDLGAARRRLSITTAILLLRDYPACAEALSKYRINPGNVGAGRQTRHAVRPDDRSGGALRQAGADRRELGQSRPGSARADDGRKRGTSHARGKRKA